jgi:hypothetical protein
MKITEKEFNVQTGETTITERDETATETQVRLERETAQATAQAEAEAKAATRQAILTRLGITEEEARILLGGN